MLPIIPPFVCPVRTILVLFIFVVYIIREEFVHAITETRWNVAIFGECAFLLLLVASATQNLQKSGGPRPETAAGSKDGAGDSGAAAKERERVPYGVRRGASARPVRLLDESERVDEEIV